MLLRIITHYKITLKFCFHITSTCPSNFIASMSGRILTGRKKLIVANDTMFKTATLSLRVNTPETYTRVYSHLGPVYTKRQCQLCNDASDTFLIENNGVTRKWFATPIWSDSIVFNKNSIARLRN